MNVIDLKNINKTYILGKKNEVRALKGVDLLEMSDYDIIKYVYKERSRKNK